VQPAAAGRITVLEDLGGTDGSTATGINAIGQIVGYSSAATGGWHAVIWESGTMTDLGAHVPPPGGDSFAGDIGDGGHVAGTTNTAEGESGSTFAVVWEDGIPRRLDRLAEPLRATAMAVNASGTVVGGAYNADGFEQPVLWDARGIVDLGLPGGGRAWDINDKGQIVGQTTSPTGSWGAFLWQNGSVRDLGTLAGGNTFATGINEAGQVVGWSSSNWRDEEHAFLWADGRMTDLGTLGGSRSAALDINDNGQVVGYSTTSISTSRVPHYHAFVWERGILTDLGTLGGDWTIAEAINNSGVIVGASNYTRGGDAEPVRWVVPTSDFWSKMALLPAARRGLAVPMVTLHGREAP
jgi:probable HAF family extracellular repeat protein